MSLPWYYNSPVWRRYCAARLMYIGGRAEQFSAFSSILLASFEMLRPSPRIRIGVGKKLPRKEEVAAGVATKETHPD